MIRYTTTSKVNPEKAKEKNHKNIAEIIFGTTGYDYTQKSVKMYFCKIIIKILNLFFI